MTKDPNSEWRPATANDDRSFGSYDEQLNEPMPPALLTKTGLIWFLFPWFFIFWKKLKFGLFDLILTVATFGSTMGSAITWLSARMIPLMFKIVPLYLIFHVNCLVFSWLQYNQRFLPKASQDSAWEKYWVRVLALGGMAAMMHVLIASLYGVR